MAAFSQLSLPSQDFAIHRHQGPPIHNDSSSLVDLSVKSYTVLMKEMQEESGPIARFISFLLGVLSEPIFVVGLTVQNL